jgi:hypothetical protein
MDECGASHGLFNPLDATIFMNKTEKSKFFFRLA